MSALPAELSTGMVHGRFIVALVDGDDADQEPDVIPATGRVSFKASVGYVPVPVTAEGPVTVMKGPIVGVLDGEGYLSTPHPTTGEPMYRGVKLLATDDPDMAVKDWTWTADYRFDSVNATTMQIPAHSFALPSGAVVDLTTMVKVPSSPGYGLPQAEAAVLRAEAVAQSVRDDADAGLFNGADGQDGAGATIETLPAGIMLSVRYNATNDLWPVRPTQRTDISVYWYGGTVKPADMLDGDVWVTSAEVVPEEPADTEAPSIPTALAATNITETGFTLNWSASTDDTGVTGYEVTIDSVSYATPTGTTLTVTGRTAETTYAVAVRARDAAGNWSAYSAPVNVTTAAAEPPVEPSGAHSIFADTTPPALSSNTDGTPSITTATGFYTFTAGANGWRCVGGRQYIPAGSPAIGKTLTIGLHPGGFNVLYGEGADLSLTPLRTGTTTAVAGWNEVTWAPYTLTPSTRVYIATGTADGTYHTSTSGAIPEPPQPSPTSGNRLYMAEGPSEGTGPRSLFRIGSGATNYSTVPAWYGQDILVDEGGA